MSSSPASSASDAPSAASNLNLRRSFTLPVKAARAPNRPPPPAPSAGSPDGIETLFTHTSTKIVSFTATAPLEASRTIPWRYPTERTLAVGVLRIYRVTSSNVSFLNSGSLLHTIFPRSQCWCVDGEHIFVLRIRQDSYYRIELPLDSAEDRHKVDEFKLVLSQVLHFERTRCPFKGTTDADAALPERPKTPPRRRTSRPTEKAKKWTFDKTWMPENGPRPSTPVLEGSDFGSASSYEDDDVSSVNTDTPEIISQSPPALLGLNPQSVQAPLPSVLERARTFQLRSVTAPSSMAFSSSPSRDKPDPNSSKMLEGTSDILEKSEERRDNSETLSLGSSTDSFYSLQTPTQRSPSPPYMDAEVEPAESLPNQLASRSDQEAGRGRGRHRRGISEVTIRAPSLTGSDSSLPQSPDFDAHAASAPKVSIRLSTPPSTPPLVSDSEDSSPGMETLDLPTPPDTIRMKRLTGASQRRAFSPMPHPQNIFGPPNRGSGQKFTAALVKKTYEILLGPPAHLVQLMLNIAAKISNGFFGFQTYRVRQPNERIPCSWESSDEDEWQEDDYGIPLGNVADPTLKRKGFAGEVD